MHQLSKAVVSSIDSSVRYSMCAVAGHRYPQALSVSRDRLDSTAEESLLQRD